MAFTADPVIQHADFAVQRRVGPTKELHTEFSAAFFDVNTDRSRYDSKTMAVLWYVTWLDDSCLLNVGLQFLSTVLCSAALGRYAWLERVF